MDDSAYFRECFVKLYVGCGVGGGVVFSFYLISVQIHDYHILRGKLVIINAAGLDGKQAAFPVDFTHISPGKGNKAIFGKKHIGFIYSLFQFF